MNGPPHIFRNYRQPWPQHQQWNNYGPRGFYPGNQMPQFRRPPGPMPKNDEYWCETCDRGFPTAAILENHKQQHQKCNIDGCQFIAHPKIITKHIQMQHSSGLFKKIAKLNNPEEIQKWREERKKKYPTKENVEKKEAEIKEKIERGEKMGLYKDKRTRASGPGHKRKQPFEADKNNKRKMFKSRHNIYHSRNQSTVSNDNNKDDPPSKNTSHTIVLGKNKTKQSQNTNKIMPKIEDRRKLQPFTGIQNLIEIDDIDKNESQENDNDLIEDDDEVIKVPETKVNETEKAIKPTVCGALSSLMCEYGSSDEESELKDSIQVNTISENILTRNIVNVSLDSVPEHKINLAVKDSMEDRRLSDNDSGPEEVKVVKLDINEMNKTLESVNSKIINKEARKNKNKNFIQKKITQTRPKPKVPSTLLQKLLYREIQHERNVVLQCIRYIVKNNYFDKKI